MVVQRTGRSFNHVSEATGNGVVKKRRQDRPSKERLAAQLIAHIKLGQKRLEKYEPKDHGACRFQSAIFQCLRNRGSDANLRKEFETLEEVLVQRLAKTQADNTIDQWMAWFDVECFKRVHTLWRKGALKGGNNGVLIPEWKSGAKIINGIVNRLVPTRGPLATHIYCAAAGMSDML